MRNRETIKLLAVYHWDITKGEIKWRGTFCHKCDLLGMVPDVAPWQ